MEFHHFETIEQVKKFLAEKHPPSQLSPSNHRDNITKLMADAVQQVQDNHACAMFREFEWRALNGIGV